MGKLYNFLLGVVVGFGLYHAAFNYHVVYANDGLHLVKKGKPRLSEVYVDVRNFNAQQWLAPPDLVLDIQKAGKDDILKQAAGDAVKEAVDRALQPAN